MTVEFQDIEEEITDTEYNTFMKMYNFVSRDNFPIQRNRVYTYHIDECEYIVLLEENFNELPKCKFILPYHWEAVSYTHLTLPTNREV